MKVIGNSSFSVHKVLLERTHVCVRAHTPLQPLRSSTLLPFPFTKLEEQQPLLLAVVWRTNEQLRMTCLRTMPARVYGEHTINVVPLLLSSFLQVDLQGIKEKFQEKYQKSLSDMVRSDTSGDFQRLLVALLH